MAIYEATIRGSGDKPRLVKADTAAQARDHFVDVKAISAERMAELIEDGAKVEKAGEAPAPESNDNQRGDSNEG